MLGGLPVVAGPILLIITVEHGEHFGARAAAATLYGLVGLSAFMCVYAALVRRASWPVCLISGWAAFLLVDALLSPLPVSAAAGFVAACVAVSLSLAVIPRAKGADSDEIDFPNWSIVLRALAAAALVFAVTTAAAALGSRWSGLLAPFPIIVSVLAGFTHAHSGPEPTLQILRGVARGMYAFAVFCLIVALLLPRASTALAFGVATIVALAIQACVLIAVGGGRKPQVA